MCGLLAALLFLHLGRPLEAACPPAHLNTTTPLGVLNWQQLEPLRTCVNVSGQGITKITGIPSQGSQLKELDLSHNSLRRLPVGLLNNTQSLERLFLQSSGLLELPHTFFENMDSLRELRLEGNPQLLSVPATLSRLCLETLSVDCRCNVVGNISSYCQRLNCTRSISCHCSSPRGFLNATDFYAQQCGGLPTAVYVAIAISALAVLVGAAAAAACLLVRRKKGGTEVKEKRKPSVSDGAQPRYISHTNPQASLAQHMGAQADYENVFVGQPQQARAGHKERRSRKPPKSRSHRKAQKDETSPGEQAIYANTQEVYYNYVGTPAPLDEDLYVLPDQ